MKKENTFKYVSFNEQIAKISVDITKWRIALPSDAGDQETFFHEAVSEFNEKDYGDHYKAFLNSVASKDLRTYAQLLHNQKEVVGALLAQLLVEDGSSYETLLELSLALARDLRDDFYQHLWEFFDAIIIIFERNSQSVDILQTGFRVLTTLFKIFWRKIVTELRRTFLRFIPLFSCKTEYIRRFSAESFAFFLRKSNSISKLITFMVSKAAEDDGGELQSGISFLIFNAMKGVSKQFVSRARELFDDILDTLLHLEEEAMRQVGMEILLGAMNLSVMYTTREHSSPLTSVLLNRLVRYSCNNDSSANKVASLINVWISERRGQVFNQSGELYQCLEKIAESLDDKFSVESSYLDLVAKCIATYHSDSTKIATLPAIINSFVDQASRNLPVIEILRFFELLSGVDVFDVWVLPSMCQYTETCIEEEENVDSLLHFYARFVSTQRPLSVAKSEASKNALFTIPLLPNLRTIITRTICKSDMSNLRRLSHCAIVWPWICTTRDDERDIFDKLFTLLNKALKGRMSKELIRLASYCAYSLSIRMPTFLSLVNIDELTRVVSTAAQDLWRLRLARIVMPFVDNWTEKISCQQLMILLREAFCSPNRECRIIAIELLDLYISTNQPELSENVFTILLQAENTPLTIQEYRSRVVFLRRLTPDSLSALLPSDVDNNDVCQVVLSVVLSQYYENLSVYWPLITEVVCNFAEGMKIDLFWPTVESAITVCQQKLYGRTQEGGQYLDGPESPDTFWCDNVAARVDHSSCRIQLFKMLSKIVFVCKAKTRYLSPLFLEVYRNEYCKIKTGSAVQNLSPGRNGKDDEDDADQSRSKISKAHSQKAFLALLELFGNFTRPRKVHSEQLIHEMYMELLLSGVEEIQKAAIKCLFTYQEKFLLDYRENIENLTSPQKFMDELVRFSIDDQNVAVAESDRENLMPYLMRIIFGLLHLQNASKINTRRAAIYRFLSGCRENEVQMFIDLTFEHFYDFHGKVYLQPVENSDMELAFELDEKRQLSEMMHLIGSKFTVSTCYRLKWIKSALTNVLQILRNMAPVLTGPQRTQIFNITLACGHYTRLISEKKVDIDPSFYGQIRELRQTVSNTFCQLFRTLQDSVDQLSIDAFFEHFVEPICISRNSRPFTDFADGIPEGILRIFLSFTFVPRLFPLLSRKLLSEQWEETNGNAVTPMELMCAFLKCKSTSDRSALEVVEGIKNLLTTGVERLERLSYNYYYQIKSTFDPCNAKGLSYGSQLVIAHVQPILEFLCTTLSSEKCLGITVYLDILKRVSEHITDPSVCEVFCRTLLKLVKSGASDRRPDDMKNLLDAVAELIINVKSPLDFTSDIFSLIPSIFSKEVRQSLFSLLNRFSLNKNIDDTEMVKQISVLVNLEAWDARKVDEPDFERRHAAFGTLSSFCSTLNDQHYNIQPHCLAAYVVVACHYLKKGSDLSLKAAAVSCLCQLSRYVGLPENKSLNLLSNVFIPECLKGLRHSNESVRLEFLTFLSTLVRFCGYHSQLQQLECLLNDDPDLDFFAGVGHIQTHRRQRAFAALCRLISTGEVNITVTVLFRFIVPLLQPYLLNFTSKTATLSDQALSLFAEVLKKATWAKYYHALNEYIKQLMTEHEKDKPIVRVIVKIIDSFHFDVKDVNLPDDFAAVSSGDTKNAADEDQNSDDEDVDNVNERKVAIIKKLTTAVLPKLKKCIDGQEQMNLAHKKAEKYYNEDDDILRAPIALATVKLLKKLPTKILEQNLHGVVLKLCSLILSRSYNVREVARKTMITVLQVLGAEYLPFVIREMKQIMRKGYQVHVMIYTVHVLIDAMKDDLKSGDLDSCLLDIIEICKTDQFSDVTEEKTVAGIINHVAEAKADKSSETYFFIGRFIGKRSLNVVVEPLMAIIEQRPQSKTVKTVSRLLESYSSGLCLNEGIDVPTLLVFVYQMMIRYTTAVDKTNEKSEEVKDKSLRPQSCLILPKAPTRVGVIVKTSVKSKSFIFIEFALVLFNAILRKTKSGFAADQLIGHLDPFVPLVVNCLSLKYDRVVSGALRSVVNLLEYPLPQLKSSITKIVETLFVLLAAYAGMGRAGDKISILELTQNLFKAFTRIIKDSPADVLSPKRIQILLNYVETDIADPNKQATAFSLLKAILAKKIVDDKLPVLIQHLAEVSVISHSPNIRAQCRQIVIFCVFSSNGKGYEEIH
uniref:DRIM domain-containing protein n=1 Tax=Steinernema glaseri TaxID=37863 RepID=A0A1I7YZH6_9BILA